MTAPFVTMPTTTRERVFGDVADNVLTGVPSIPPNDVEGRTAALNALFDYLCSLVFYRSGGVGKPPHAFQLDRTECYVEWPENVEELKFPAVGVQSGDGQTMPIGLSPVIDDDSIDVYGKGTALWRLWDYHEPCALEVWATSRAERRALIAGIQQAFSPSMDVSNLRLTLPTYFNTLACYTLISVQRVDDQAPKNRRLAVIRFDLQYEVVRHARYLPLDPTVYMDVSDVHTSTPDYASRLGMIP